MKAVYKFKAFLLSKGQLVEGVEEEYIATDKRHIQTAWHRAAKHLLVNGVGTIEMIDIVFVREIK